MVMRVIVVVGSVGDGSAGISASTAVTGGGGDVYHFVWKLWQLLMVDLSRISYAINENAFYTMMYVCVDDVG